MKIIKLLCLFIALALLSACSDNYKEGTYLVKGKIEGVRSGFAYLLKTVNRENVPLDTVEIKNGEFIFKGTVEMPEIYIVQVDTFPGEIRFFIENAQINLKGKSDSIENIKISGSATEDLFVQFQKQYKPFEIQDEEIYNAWKTAKDNKDETGAIVAEAKSDSLNGKMNEFVKSFIASNTKSVVAPYLVIRHLIWGLKYNELKQITESFDSTITKSFYVQKLKERVNLLGSLQPGQPAPEFTMNDINGKPLSLSTFKGKVVLIDFWASWCSPCRALNPKIVALYKKFGKNKNFTILGVSLDKNDQDWKKAIKDDNLTWQHVSDLQGWKNAAAALYGVMSIPHSFLIDKEGKIIGDEMTTEELEIKLKEILK